jgi:hypothetical protein
MPNTERIPGRRGRKPAVLPPGLKMLGAYLTSPLPAPALPLDASGGFTGWEMLGNGPDASVTNQGPNFEGVGDCGPVDTVHKRMADLALSALLHGTPLPADPMPDANTVVADYLAYDGGQDEGVVGSEMMHAWYTSGLIGSKIDGYAPVPLDQIDAAMAVFGAVLVGVNLTDDADQLFNQGQPWNVDQGQKPDPNEGHFILKIKSTADQDGYVTWGAEQWATKGWTRACAEEAWVPITPEMARRWNVAMGLLVQDIDLYGGSADAPPSPGPAPAPPAPAPSPPGPGPAPGPGVVAEVEHDVEALAADVEHDVEQVVHDLEGQPGAGAPASAG